MPGDVNAPGPPARIIYTNHRGETRERTIVPVSIWYGDSEYHPGPQWLLGGIDVERGEARTFAMKGIVKWL